MEESFSALIPLNLHVLKENKCTFAGWQNTATRKSETLVSPIQLFFFFFSPSLSFA